MKLLIITQTVDCEDPVLGFFHAWLQEFARHVEALRVVAQSAGTHDLPSNVTVSDLGKQRGASSWTQVLRFWSLIWRHRSSYDAVFVHMTPIWVILGAPLWIVLRKRVYLWYEIKRGSLKLTLAMFFIRKVFAASPQGIPRASRKLVVTGHGIDIEACSPDATKFDPELLVTVGRVTCVKRMDVLLEAFAAMPQHMRFTIAGGTVTDDDAVCLADLEGFLIKNDLRGRVQMGWVPPSRIPSLLRSANVFIHAAEGGLDKALLQAMACGCPVLSSSEAAREELPPECRTSNERFAEHLAKLLALSTGERQRLSADLRTRVTERHALPRCIDRLIREMQS